MSENNTRNKGNKRDSFAKPGDESIVSGKSFFLSFGKQKKSSANPLLESEKNKSNAKNDKEQNNNREAQKQNVPRKSDERENKASEKNDNIKEKNNFRNKNHRRPDKRKNDGNGRNGRNGDHKNQNNKGNTEAKEQQNRQAQRQNQNQRKPDKKDKKNIDELAKEKNINQPEQERNAKKGAGNTGNFRHDQTRRQKHKKEKFVPTAPAEEIKSEELLQPIVDKAGIISAPRGFGMRTGKSSFMSSARGTAAGDGDEPRYIDRNRPLAEQIIEQSKPKTYKNHLTENTETVEVIGVRFREAGKVYYFAPGLNKVEKDAAVIVETARGIEYGFCAIPNRHVSTDNIVPPLKPILRVATKDDTERYESNKQLEAGAAKVFREKVRALGLEMSLVYVEYTFDNGKLLFYFTADGRVDFRELIKELAAAFRTRIELRQIGVRDEAKIVGGLGICGRPVCCKSFLGEFSQVSIKMAKDQNLFINSSKISGTCGRFMCCIRYEDEVYQKEYERTPKVDAIVETAEGKGVVVESNALRGMVKVLLDDKPEDIAKPFKCTEVKLLGYVKRENENEIPEGVEIHDEGTGS